MERENSLPSVPPPPPPVEESNYTVRYGNGADPIYNNDIADDESVEAQHVVYTFAEEKNSKAGRRKWTVLMLSIVALLVTIIALGAVYGTQRRNRNQALAEANEALTANATTIAPVDVADVLDGDLYVTPGNATLNGTVANTTLTGNATNVTELEVDNEDDEDDDEDEFSGTEEPTTWVTSRFGQRIFPTDEPESSGTMAPTEEASSSGTVWTGTRRPVFVRFPNRPNGRPNGRPGNFQASRDGWAF